jgi:DnaJ domain
MDHRKAFDILEIEIDNCTKIDMNYLKRQYHKLALRNHPDKNGNTFDSNKKFQDINEAYYFLKKEIDDDHRGEDDPCEQCNEYTDYVQMFFNEILNGKYTELFIKIIKDIVMKTNISINLFEGLDRETSLNVYTFLSKYRSVFHLSQETLNLVKEIVTNKFGDVTVYTLNPSINDLFDNNIYKLYETDQLYLVPLWHRDVYFDSRIEESNEIIVLCHPQLPPGVTIDEENNLYTEITICVHELNIQDENIKLSLGRKQFEIPMSQLSMKREQVYRIKKQGVSKVKDDLYDVTDKADIVVKLKLL